MPFYCRNRVIYNNTILFDAEMHFEKSQIVLYAQAEIG